MKKKYTIAVLLALLLCLPAGSALAAPMTLYVDGVDALANPVGNGWSYADGVLTLNNAHISQTYPYSGSADAGVYFKGGDLTIELVGENGIQITPVSNHIANGIASAMSGYEKLHITGNGSLTIGFTSASSGSLYGCYVMGNPAMIGTGSDAPKVYITTGDARNDSIGLVASGFELKSGLLSICAGSAGSELSYGISDSFGVPALSKGTLIIQTEEKALESFSADPFDDDDRFAINASEWYWRTDANAAWNAGEGNGINFSVEGKEPYQPKHFEWTTGFVDVTAVAGDGGSVSGGGSCAMYTASSVTLTATPDAGYKFVKWQNAAGAVVSTDADYTFTATEDTQLTAVFEKLPVPAVPQTGDNSNVILWSALVFISLMGITLVSKRKEA